ncbi:hypothetical protein [Bacillus arachidis]|uniref:Uncharacterized protein n=1 Tax=Bacillus arachidis TaxID=2819290 RepID=A0ABS3P6P1_9BACI|nr:hypothetical protein [Bacillus arachidis]MBO1628487.1 hypothetical protein [Bacillus arachidis]
MSEWKTIKIDGVSNIEKCRAEFIIWSIGDVPSGKFKVRIVEDQNGRFIGYTNLAILVDGSPNFFSGYGKNIEEALQDTVHHFMDALKERKPSIEKDFEWADPSDF